MVTARVPIDLPPGPERSLAELFRRLADTAKLDNQGVARAAQVTPGYVSELLNGKKTPRPATADLLALALRAGPQDRQRVQQLADEAAERKRHRRATTPRPARTARFSSDLSAVYLAFLTKIDSAHNRLRAVARGDVPGDLLDAANSVLERSGVYEERDRLLTSGGTDVVAAGERAFFALVEVRNAVRAGASLDAPAYHDAYHPFAETLWQFRLAVRAEQGHEPLSPGDVHRVDWSDRDRCVICSGSGADADRAQAGPPERADVGVRVPHPALRDT